MPPEDCWSEAQTPQEDTAESFGVREAAELSYFCDSLPGVSQLALCRLKTQALYVLRRGDPDLLPEDPGEVSRTHCDTFCQRAHGQLFCQVVW